MRLKNISGLRNDYRWSPGIISIPTELGNLNFREHCNWIVDWFFARPFFLLARMDRIFPVSRAFHLFAIPRFNIIYRFAGEQYNGFDWIANRLVLNRTFRTLILPSNEQDLYKTGNGKCRGSCIWQALVFLR